MIQIFSFRPYFPLILHIIAIENYFSILNEFSKLKRILHFLEIFFFAMIILVSSWLSLSSLICCRIITFSSLP